MIERLGLDARQPGRRDRLQRRLPAAVLPRARDPRARHRAGGERRRGRRRRRASRRSSSSSARTSRARSPASPRADLLLGNNVLAHVPDLNDFVAGMKVLLKPGGVITMEFPHLLRLIEDNQWDTIYHEHFSYFSFLTVSARVRRARAAPVRRRGAADARRLAAHLRRPRRRRATSPRRDAARELRRARARRRLRAARHLPRLRPARRAGQAPDPALPDRPQASRACASPATARRRRATRCSTTAASRRDFIDYTCDLNPHKQGHFLPGSHIPIRSPDAAPRGPARRRADPAVEPQGRDRRSSSASSASGAGASRRARRS